MNQPADVPPRARRSWPQIVTAIVLLMAAIVLARDFLMPVFLAFLLALTVSPIRRFLQRRGIAPSLTAAALVAALFMVLGVLILLLYEPVQNYATNSGQIAADVERKLRGISETIEKVADAGEQVEKMTSGEADPDVEEVVIKSPDMVTRLASSAPYLVAQSVFMLVLLFFITASGDLFYAKIVEASPTFRDKRRAIGIAKDIEKRISRYFLTITVINAGLGVSIGLTLWWLGMPNPLLFGVMAFSLNFIPYIGALAGVAVTFAIGIVSFPTVGDAGVAALAYLALTTLEGQFITPYAVGRRLALNPVIVFISVAFWGWAWSVIGMFIAVPLLIVALVISERIEGLEGLAIFLSGDRPPDPSEEEREAA